MKKVLCLLSLLCQFPALFAASPDLTPPELPMYQGLPLLDVAVRGARAATQEEIDIGRWFALQHLADDPSLLENADTALMYAAAFVPPGEWHHYMDGCRNTLNSCTPDIVGSWQPPYLLGRNGPGRWLGGNYDDYALSHAAFVRDYGTALVQLAVELPQDMWVLTDARLSPGQDALGLRSPEFLTSINGTDDVRRRLPLWIYYSAPVENRLPETLTCAPRSCIEILEGHSDHANISAGRPATQQYPVFLLAKVRVNKINTRGIMRIGSTGYSLGSHDSAAELIGDFELFYDRELTRKVATLPR